MTKKKYRRYSPEFKRHTLKRVIFDTESQALTTRPGSHVVGIFQRLNQVI
jgi:hypothetical protein